MRLIKFLLVLTLILNYEQTFSQYSVPKEPLGMKYDLDTEEVPVLNPGTFDNEKMASEVKSCLKGEWKGQSKCEPIEGKSIPFDLNFPEDGKLIEKENGKKVWRVIIHSSSAKSYQFTADHYDLPKGVSLFFYSLSQNEPKVYGAFTHNNNKEHYSFSTGLLPEGKVMMEMNFDSGSFNKTHLEVNRIGYFFVNDLRRDFEDSEPCHINVNCNPWNQDWCSQIRSNVNIRILKHHEDCDEPCYLSSSAVLANNSKEDFRPLLLLTQHQIEDAVNPEDWLVYFNFQSPECNPDIVGNDEMMLRGVNILEESGSTSCYTWGDPDLALLELEEDIPIQWNPYFSGWDARGLASETFTAIHHPAGDVKKVSEGETKAFHNSYCWRIEWNDGSAEGGSSGGGVYLENKLLAGVHKGATGRDDVCETDDWTSKSAMLASFFEDIEDYLAPNYEERTLEGIDPIEACQENIEIMGYNFWPGNDWQEKNEIIIQAEKTIDVEDARLQESPAYMDNTFQPDYELRAGEEIVLKDEFIVPEGSEFKAHIDPCESFQDNCGFNHKTLGTDGLQAKTMETQNEKTETFSEKESKQEHEKTEVNVFPNPFEEEVTFKFPHFENKPPWTIKIMDVKGRLIKDKEGEHVQEEIAINTKGFNEGVFFYKVNFQNKMFNGKIIKER